MAVPLVFTDFQVTRNTDQSGYLLWRGNTGSLCNTVLCVRHILSTEKVMIHFLQTMSRASSTMSAVLGSRRLPQEENIDRYKSRSHNEDGGSELLAGAPNRQWYKFLNFWRRCTRWQIDSDWTSYYHQCWNTDWNNNELHRNLEEGHARLTKEKITTQMAAQSLQGDDNRVMFCTGLTSLVMLKDIRPSAKEHHHCADLLSAFLTCSDEVTFESSGSRFSI